MGSAGSFCFFMFMMYGFFGVGLLAAPRFMFGPDSIICYWTVWSEEASLWFARAFGLFMLCTVSGPFLFGVNPAALCKQYLVLNLGCMHKPSPCPRRRAHALREPLTSEPWHLPVLLARAVLPLFLWTFDPSGGVIPSMTGVAPLTTTGPGANALLPVNLWFVQLCIHVPTIIWNFVVVASLPAKISPDMY